MASTVTVTSMPGTSTAASFSDRVQSTFMRLLSTRLKTLVPAEIISPASALR